MQLLVTSDQMQQFDKAAIRNYSIPGIILMENAGRSFVDLTASTVEGWAGRTAFIFCGKGNNGGDGFVIARHLLNRGAQVRVFLLGKKSHIKGDARTNLLAVLKLSSSRQAPLRFTELTSMRSLSTLAPPDVIVDAILGTGFTGPLEGLYARVATWINRSGSQVLSADIASGVNSSTGIVETVAVQAGQTVTMGLAKVGQFIGAGKDHSGEVTVADIGIPGHLFTAFRGGVARVDREDVAGSLPERSPRAHKHSVGKIFILAGSRGYTGAPYMCSVSAMKAGAGAVVLGVPQSIHMILAKKVTEVMVSPLAETSEGTVSAGSTDEIIERANWADVVVLGPGLSRHEETMGLVRSMIEKIRKPLVLDADALNAMNKPGETLRKRKSPTILTPHVGELSRMSGDPAALIESYRVGKGEQYAKMFSSVLVLKGAPTVVAVPNGEVYLNSTGNPGMATAGSGDVLTGIIAALAAQGSSEDHAARNGVYIHGLAGDIAARDFGERGMVALDISDHIPAALKEIGS